MKMKLIDPHRLGGLPCRVSQSRRNPFERWLMIPEMAAWPKPTYKNR